MALFKIESAYAPVSGVRAAASGEWPAAVVEAYCASTLELDEPYMGENTPARALVGKVLQRGPLLPPPPLLERAAGAGVRAPALLRAAHWAQLACWLAGGVPAAVEADLPELTRAQSRAAAAWGVADLAELWSLCARLYGEEVPPLAPLLLSDGMRARGGWVRVGARRGWEEGAAWAPPGKASGAAVDLGALDVFLRRLLGRASFRPGQREAVAALLGGRDALVALPTAAGKSLVFQLAGLLRPGTAVVVEPLVALARDQRRALAERGVRAAAPTAREDGAADLARLSEGRLPFLFLSPERLETAKLRGALRAAVETAGVSLIAFDEAHCAADWGHDFRPAYAAVGARAKLWCADERRRPPVLACTGTASPRALAGAASELGLQEPAVVRGGTARPGLRFLVERIAGDPLDALERALSRKRPLPGEALVFCPRVEDAARAANRLSERLGLKAAAFTGRPPDGRAAADWDAERSRAADELRRGRLQVLCCTTAFSLGVDVPGVRRVLRVGLPDSLEELFQEAGRAGRDGGTGECLILSDVARPADWVRRLSPGRPLEDVRREVEGMRRGRRDDAWAAAASHLRRFPGEDVEAADLAWAAARLSPWGPPRAARLALEGRSPAAAARALSRLERAGVLSVERREETGFSVELREVWSADEAWEAGRRELARVYRVLEPARRASLAALVTLVCAPEPGAALSAALGRLAEHEPAEELEVGVGGAAPRDVLRHPVAARLGELLRVVVEAAGAGDAFR